MISLENRINQDFPSVLIDTIPLSIIKTSQSVLDVLDIKAFLENVGYTVLLDDPYLDFRRVYETQFRQRIELNDFDSISLIIITTASLDQIDFDILEQAENETRVFDYSFSQVFPTRIFSIENLIQHVPKDYDGWTEFAQDLGQLLYNFYNSDEAHEYGSLLFQLLNKVNLTFSDWCGKNYSLILTAPYIHSPKTLNNILPHIAYKKRKHEIEKVALLVFDGMSFDQWSLIKKEISFIDSSRIGTDGIFAMVPTLTSVSRQAIFAGKLPKEYSQSINTTQKEKEYWESFWEGENSSEVKYIKPQEDFQEQLKELRTCIEDDRVQIIGTVFSIVDELMHKMSQGYSQMYNSILLWLKRGYLKETITELMDKGFDIYITADHGNIEALPGGKLNEGNLVDTKGQRVRIYDRETARDKAMLNYKDLLKIESEKYALPDSYFAVAQKKAEYFGSAGQVITHGGLSVQEVIVPFIHIKKVQE